MTVWLPQTSAFQAHPCLRIQATLGEDETALHREYGAFGQWPWVFPSLLGGWGTADFKKMGLGQKGLHFSLRKAHQG